MIRQTAFIALSTAIVLCSTAGAMAASKKTNNARHAFAAATETAAPPTDPRETYDATRKGAFHTWCDVNPECNGWGQWLRDVNSGKLKYQ